MKRILGICLIFLVLSGCSESNNAMEQALQFRSKLLAATACSFDAKITADYGDIIYTFLLRCQTNNDGDLVFTVIEPETICGITGTISQVGGKITFDDKALFFEEISQGQITPVGAPWVMMNALKSGYIKGAGDTAKGILLQVDDCYSENAMHLNINLDSNHLPYFAEIFYDSRRILSVEIENFIIV